MRKIMLVAAVLLGGCPAQDGGADKRLEVNDTLRARCPQFDDGFIETLLLGFESDRLAGASRRDMELAAIDACDDFDPAITVECAECGFAIISQIFGD